MNTGWAIWANARLKACGVVSVRRGLKTATAARMIANQIPLQVYSQIFVEEMAFRPGDRKSKPKDLLKVQGIGFYVAGLVSPPGAQLRAIPSTEWGAGPDRVIEHRVRKRLEEMAMLEIAESYLATVPKGMRVHAWDALAIGLFGLGLVGRGVVYLSNPYGRNGR